MAEGSKVKIIIPRLSIFIKSLQQLNHLVQTRYMKSCKRDIMLSERDIKLFGRDIKLSERDNNVVRTRYYVVITT